MQFEAQVREEEEEKPFKELRESEDRAHVSQVN